MPGFSLVGAYVAGTLLGLKGTILVAGIGLSVTGALVASVVAAGVATITSRLINGRPGAGGTKQDPGVRQQLPPNTDNKIPIVYGRAHTKGTITDARISSDNQVMTYVMVLSEKTSDTAFSLGSVYWNDELLTFNTTAADSHKVSSSRDQNGFGTTSTNLANLLEVRVYAGSASTATNQIFPTDATNKVSARSFIGESSSTYLLNDLVYAVVKITYSAEQSVTNLAPMTFEVINELSNPGSVLYDYLTNPRYGAGISPSDIDTDLFVSLTDDRSLRKYSREIPPNQFNSDGTTSTQFRYVINGVLSAGESVQNNLEKLTQACASWLTYDFVDGKWKVIINRALSAPDLDACIVYDDDSIVGEVSVNATNLEDLYNSIEVEFPNREIRDQSDYYRASTTSTQRNNFEPDNTLNLRTDMLNNAIHAQRVGLIELNQSRVDKSIQFRTTYKGLQTQAGDVIKVTNEVYGFTDKLFRVTRVREVEDENGGLFAEITGLEYNASVYTDTNITDYQPNQASGIPSFGGQVALPAPGTVAIVSQSPSANQPTFRISTTLPATSGPVDRVLWYYTTTVSLDVSQAVYITDEVGPFTGGQTVFENIFALNSGTYYILARSQRSGSISAFSDLGQSPPPGPFTYSTRIDWNPTPAGASNGSINTATNSSRINVLTTSTGAGFIPIVSATSGFQPVYADADLTFSAAPNTLGIAGVAAGINFVNTGTKITSPMALTSPLMFQSNITNSISYIGVQVNGTGATAGVSIFGQSDVFDSQTFRHGVTANTEVFFNSTRNGTTRTLLPMNFYAGGGLAMSITTATRAVAIFSGTSASSTNTGALIVPFGGVGVGGTIYQGGIHTIANNTNASSTQTGALQIVNGGAGIGGNVFIGGELTVAGTAWTSYTPTWTSSGTAPALNNGTLTGSYKQIGKTVFVRARLQIGSTTTTGTGNWRFALPVAAKDSAGVVMSATFLDNGTNWYMGAVNCEYDGNTGYVVPLTSASPSGAVTGTVPFTWNTGDSLVFNGSYEAA